MTGADVAAQLRAIVAQNTVGPLTAAILLQAADEIDSLRAKVAAHRTEAA
jgi:hypothetical protein